MATKNTRGHKKFHALDLRYSERAFRIPQKEAQRQKWPLSGHYLNDFDSVPRRLINSSYRVPAYFSQSLAESFSEALVVRSL